MQNTIKSFNLSYPNDALIRPRKFTDRELNDAFERFRSTFNAGGLNQVLSCRIMQTEAGLYIDLSIDVPAGDHEIDDLRVVVDAVNAFLKDELGISVMIENLDVRDGD